MTVRPSSETAAGVAFLRAAHQLIEGLELGESELDFMAFVIPARS